MATDKQTAFIRSLLVDLGWASRQGSMRSQVASLPHAPRSTRQTVEEWTSTLSTRQASDVIDALLKRRQRFGSVTRSRSSTRASAAAEAQRPWGPREGEFLVERPSRGRDDQYQVGDVLWVQNLNQYGVVVRQRRVHDDDMDQWMVQAILRPATAEEAREVHERRMRDQELAKRRDQFRRVLHSYTPETQVSQLPEGSRRIGGEYHPGGSEAWWLGPDGHIYYRRQSYDLDRELVWRTDATLPQVEEAIRLGLLTPEPAFQRPSLFRPKSVPGISQRAAAERFVNPRAATGRARQRRPDLDIAKQARTVAPAQANTPKDVELQRRWFRRPNELDMEGIDTPQSPLRSRLRSPFPRRRGL